MTILKLDSRLLDTLPTCALRPDKLILGTTRKPKDEPNLKKVLNNKTIDLLDKLKALGFTPFVNPQTGFVMAPTSMAGISLCLNPERGLYEISLRNPLGKTVGPKAALCKDIKDVQRFTQEHKIAPQVDSISKDKEQKVNLLETNSTTSATHTMRNEAKSVEVSQTHTGEDLRKKSRFWSFSRSR